MSTAAVMLVKDEADVIEYTLRHLADEVDEVFVADNGSTDGTLERLLELADTLPLRLTHDHELGYWQARKTSELASRAREAGHEWVIPCDADEYWYATDGRRLREWLGGLAPDVAFVRADLYNHLPCALDPIACEPCQKCKGGRGGLTHDASCAVCAGHGAEPNPFLRIGWRQREHGALPKVACRLRPGLEIHAGNHSAWAPGSGVTVGGLVVRHFSWRSREQYLRKIRNGEAAYAATSLPETTGAHWRMWEGKPDETVVGHFDTWFWLSDPSARDDVLYDPAPFVERSRA